MSSKHFHQLLEKCKEIHDKKSHDYATDNEPFSNFERAAQIASWFKSDHDKVFVTLISIKIARLAELCSGKQPNNESIGDSFIDLVNYCGLWGAFYLEKTEFTKFEENPLGRLPEFCCSNCHCEEWVCPDCQKDHKCLDSIDSN